MTSIKSLGGTIGVANRNVDKTTPVSQQPEVAAQQFEALLVQQMLQSMWSTVPKHGLLSGSNEESMYRDMLNEALANSIAEGKGLGIKDVILKDINRINKSK
jgi:Rod binding domain-containing protein